jgi:hypothetical protein
VPPFAQTKERMIILRHRPSTHRLWITLTLLALGCSGATTTAVTTPNRTRHDDAARIVQAPAQTSGPLQIVEQEAIAVEPELPTTGLAPMQGEPDAQALQQVRLVPTSCEKLQAVNRQLVESRVKQMREAIMESLADWRAQQPQCWEMYRERATIGENGAYRVKSSAAVSPRPSAAMSPAATKASRDTMDRKEMSKPKAESAVRSASGTNNQVEGVDEADIVKHDGRFVYFAVHGGLKIASIDPPRIVSVTRIPGAIKELFVEGDRAVVYSSQGGRGGARCTYGYDCQFAGDGSSTSITVFDVTDRAAPRSLRQLELSGSLMAARRIGSAIHSVIADGDVRGPQYSTWPADLPDCGVREATVKARLKRLAEENERAIRAGKFTDGLPTLTDRGQRQTLCQNLVNTPLADGSAFTTIVSFDLANEHTAPTTATIQSRPGAVFVSENALYLSVTHQRGAQGRAWYGFYPQIDEVSDIHKFRLGSRPEMTTYAGSGAVPGHVLNQFSMDEWCGYLRIATTRGKVPDPNVESQVSVFAEARGGNLIRTGAVEHLARGEDIRSVRFDDDRGYVVTFKKTDPLFVLDLRRPHQPKVLGELKIPGFSTYMHRIDPNHLLSIGLDANDHGDFAFFDGVILQLFDVTQPTAPKLMHKEKIGTRGSSSEALTNHLAFNFFRERGLLAIPMTVCEGGGDGSFGRDLTFSGLLVYGVSVRDGFHRIGGVNHATGGGSCSTWWSNANSAVKRSLFLDDWVWSIALDRAKVQKLSRLGYDVADLSLN